MRLRHFLKSAPPVLPALALLLALGALSDCTTWQDRVPPALPTAQTPYRQGVPSAGGPGEPFFPIGLYHALDSAHTGETLSLADIAAAGFNTVHVWEGLRLEPVLSEARSQGLRVLFHHPRDEEIAARAGDPALLAWYLDEEPSLHVARKDQETQRRAFLQRRAQVRRLDPTHPVLALDMAAVTGAGRADWVAWAGLGDISAHDNYPIRWASRSGLDTPNGIPASVSLAVRTVRERKPVWLVVQAMASPAEGWRMPEPEELRAMVFAGLIHGATGLIYFALDSFVTREGQVLGIAPAPRPAYTLPPGFGRAEPAPLVADAEDRAASRRLWAAVVSLNQELRALAPDLLAPTAPGACEARVSSRSDAPVRTLLKMREGRLTLLAVNLERSAVPALFVCAPDTPEPWASRVWETVFAPLEARVMRAPG